MEKLSYAKDEDGNIVNILDVKNGASCNCVCLCCNNPLIAKQGKVKKWHFSHISSDCKYAKETELHYLAKMEIEKRMEVPILDILEYEKENEYPHMFMHNYRYRSMEYIRMVKIDKVYIEKSMGDFKPDVIVIINGKPLLVEIAVTHFIDKEKEQKIINSGIPCMEIDLSAYKKIENIDIGDILFNKIHYYNIAYFNNKKFSLKKEQIFKKNELLNTVENYYKFTDKTNTVLKGTLFDPFVYCKETALKINPSKCSSCKYKICSKPDGTALCSFNIIYSTYQCKKYINEFQKKITELGYAENFISK